MVKEIAKPQEGEYAPYTIMYIKLVPDDGRVLDHLKENIQKTKALIAHLPDSRLCFSFAEGEWTIKEILGHVIDTERIFAYRALRFARNDMTPLSGFEQNDYVPYSGANDRSIEDIFDEFASVRNATLTLFNSLSDEAFMRAGLSSNNRLSVRAVAYIIAGHELHHVNSIKENYLSV